MISELSITRASVDTFDVEQCSEEWFALRRGIPTASKFKAVMADGRGGEPSKTRADYMLNLAGEILTGRVAEDFQNEYMKRGKRMEPMALDWYERTHFADLQRIGFVRRTVMPAFAEGFLVGGSPDAYWPEQKKVIEVKTMMPRLIIPIAKKGAAGFPTEHWAQCQGHMWLMGAETCDLIIFYEGWRAPLKFTIERDDQYIGDLASQVETFVHELRSLVNEIRSKDKAWGAP
jgi:hypothetical protein